MKRTIVLIGLITAVHAGALAQENPLQRQAKVTELWEPVPPTVTVSESGRPSDAIALFDGTDLSSWQSVRGGEAKWRINADGSFTVVPRSGDIVTKRAFGDIQLHIEWRTPERVVGKSQGRGNSGVFLMERYELQVLDSYDNPTYVNGQAASVYKQHIPLVNAASQPGVWQTYDIIFTAPRFGTTGRVVQPARLTVLHNGVLVQHHVALQGPTQFVGTPKYEPHGPAGLRLQDHGNPVSYRNIWVREL